MQRRVFSQWLASAATMATWTGTAQAQTALKEGSDFVRLGANVPVGHSGLKLSPFASQMDYKVVTPDAAQW